ncbi:hypothetical protein NM688_g5803 [Phlebia brevispora]|uniref:Uncharacterized protein n=1 Tax=Phlebia brevispora TaxID=194682 RepID=A0ACC1SPL4_9APHY|nr:hypothetical protein NM688_g5803 [Phlebia brevispora]
MSDSSTISNLEARLTADYVACAMLALAVYECDNFLKTFNVLQTLPCVTTAIFSALRVFALSNRNLNLSILVAVMGLIPIPINAYMAIQFWNYDHHPVLGNLCIGTGQINIRTDLLSSALGMGVAVVIADTTVIVVTWKKTWKTLRVAFNAGVTISVTEVLFRDGCIYFIALFAMNISFIVIKVSGSYAAITLESPAACVLNVMQCLLLSRFISNLRHTNPEDEANSSLSRFSKFTVPGFRIPTMQEVVYEMGQPLEYEEQNAYVEGEDGGLTGTPDSYELSGIADSESSSRYDQSLDRGHMDEASNSTGLSADLSHTPALAALRTLTDPVYRASSRAPLEAVPCSVNVALKRQSTFVLCTV